MAAASDNTDLDANYSRFPEKALRVAMLLGLLGGVFSIAALWFSPVRHLRTVAAQATPPLTPEELPITE